MTIEVRQLVIRAVVSPAPASSVVPLETSQPFSPPEKRAPSTHEASPLQQDALVAACVREVLRKLQRAQQR